MDNKAKIAAELETILGAVKNLERIYDANKNSQDDETFAGMEGVFAASLDEWACNISNRIDELKPRKNWKSS